MTGDPTTECPRANKACAYTRGERLCSLWEVCSEIETMREQLADLEQIAETHPPAEGA